MDFGSGIRLSQQVTCPFCEIIGFVSSLEKRWAELVVISAVFENTVC